MVVARLIISSKYFLLKKPFTAALAMTTNKTKKIKRLKIACWDVIRNLVNVLISFCLSLVKGG